MGKSIIWIFMIIFGGLLSVEVKACDLQKECYKRKQQLKKQLKTKFACIQNRAMECYDSVIIKLGLCDAMPTQYDSIQKLCCFHEQEVQRLQQNLDKQKEQYAQLHEHYMDMEKKIVTDGIKTFLWGVFISSCVVFSYIT